VATSIAKPLLLVLLVAVIAAGGVLVTRAAPVGLLDIERGRSDLIAAAERFRDRAGPGYQHEALAAIRRTCPYSRVLRLDETPPSAVAESAAQEAPAQRQTILFEADFTRGERAGFEIVDEDTRIDEDAAALALRAGQVRTSSALDIARERIGTIEIEAATSAPSHLLIGWSDRDDALRLLKNKARVDLVADSQMHTYSIDAAKALERGLDEDAVVRRLFLSARGDGKSPVRIQRIRVHSWQHRYPASGHGISYEKLGGELRRTLFQMPGHTLRFEVTMPVLAPVFEAGLGSLGARGTTEFSLTLVEETRSYELLKRIDNGVGWDDVRVDLSRWAGKRVALQMSARAEGEAVALWSSPVIRSEPAEDHAPPSIVMILEDALRADRLATYGGPVASPGHDRLAARGVVFERAFAQAPQTRSSVPSLMTSLLPSATGTWDFSDSLREDYVTLAEALRTCGYQTASFLQNGNAGVYAGLHQGFDVVVDEEQAGISASQVYGLAHGWIEAQKERPFFVYIHVLDPHGPFDPELRPAVAAGAGEPSLEVDRAIDPVWLEQPTASARRALYDGEVASTDAALDAFLASLATKVDKTVVALLADHGEYLGEHGGMWRHHPPGHLEVTRVPLQLAGPGLQAGRRVATPVALLDLMPTLLELAGVDGGALAMQGRSLLSLKSGRSTRLIVSEEPQLERGERRAQGCGSLYTAEVQVLLACISDQASLSARTLAAADELARPPVRAFDIGASYGGEKAMDRAVRMLLEHRTRAVLETVQSIGIEGWRRMSGGSDAVIRSAPEQTERLRALGYVE